MGKEMVVTAGRHETRVAILEDDQLVEVYFQREKEYSLAGSIHKGRVTRVLPGMQSAFVDLGLERDTFLYVSDFLEDHEEFADSTERSAGGERGERSERPERTERSDRGGRGERGGRGRGRDRDRDRGGDRGNRYNAATAEPAVSNSQFENSHFERVQAAEPVAEAEVEVVETAGGAGAAVAREPEESAEGVNATGADRNGRRRRRRRGGRDRGDRGGIPESKYSAAPAEDEPGAGRDEDDEVEAPEVAPVAEARGEVDADEIVLPGESIRKYRRTEPAAVVSAVRVVVNEQPLAEEEADDDAPGAVDREAEIDELQRKAEELLSAGTLSEAEVSDVQEALEEAGEEVEAADAVDAEAAEAEDEAGGEAPEEGGEAALPVAGYSAHVRQRDNSQLVQQRERGGRRRRGRGRRSGSREEVAPETVAPVTDGEVAAVVVSEDGAGEAAVQMAPAAPAYEQRPRREERGGRGDREGRGEREGRGDRRDDRRDRGDRRPPVPSISELLKEGQEILVQIAKEPLGQKGARITSHIALPGRYCVYMPTVDHTGVSRKIASDEERSRLKRILKTHAAGMPGGFICRTAGEGKTEQQIAQDIKYLYDLWTEIRKKADSRKAPALLYHDVELVERILRDQLTDDFKALWVDKEDLYEQLLRFVHRFQPDLVGRVKLWTRPTPIFDAFNISNELEKALRPKVWLKSGGYIVINQTEALVAIDINTGKFVGKSNRLEDTIVKTNLEAVKEIVRQMRLRDLGGIIVIDFIDMEERKNRQKVMGALEDAMRVDKAPYKILQFNDFGLVAITRKRVKQSLERTLCMPCPHCEGAAYIKSANTTITEIIEEAKKITEAVKDQKECLLRVNPDVAKVLKSKDTSYLEEIEEILGRPVLVTGDLSIHHEKFDLA